MNLIFLDYFSIFVFICISVALSVILFLASYLIASQKADLQKLTAYECGFDPFGDARLRFDVRFYLVAILFIVFDLEAIFVFPWATTLSMQGDMGFFAMVDFLVELLVGLVYAWSVGALEWD